MSQLEKLDFSNTEIAFSSKSDKDLRKAAFLFSLMGNPRLVNYASKIGVWALRHDLPWVEGLIKYSIFEQFCGGSSLEDCKSTISHLANYNIQSIPDYSAEAKTTEEEFDNSLNEFISAIDFAAKNVHVPVISLKITALAKFELLEKKQAKLSLKEEEEIAWKALLGRLDKIAKRAEEKRVGIFIDAEESWIQQVIDQLAQQLQSKHNKAWPIIYNTFQMYRHDRLEYLRRCHQHAQEEGYILAAKLVRGAYMEKEQARAKALSYSSPIQPDKAASDRDYNLALSYCIENYQSIASYNASHNLESCLFQAQLIDKMGIARNHPHLNFCQLYGMSPQISFNLAHAGYNVRKYLPYGEIKEVIPYLIRRAEENKAVKGELGREYQLIRKEVGRRKRARSKAFTRASILSHFKILRDCLD